MADTMTAEERTAALAFFAAAAAKGANPATSAPATQKFLARWNDKRTDENGQDLGPGYDFYKNPNFEEKAETPKTVGGSEYGNWEKVNGVWTQVTPPQQKPSNPDEDRSKAIKAQTDEADRDRKLLNERLYGLYADDKTLADINHLDATDKLAAARLREDIKQNAAKNKQEDDKLSLQNKEFLLKQAAAPGERAKTGAETARIGAETDLTRAQIVALGIKTESDTDRAVAAGQLDKAQADKIKAELARGEPVTAPTDQEFLTRRSVTGELITERNPNYQGLKAPTTRGELVQRTATLTSQMQAMKDKIAADASIPKDQQAARFNQWYDQTIAPQIGALEQQQTSIIRDEALKNAEAQRAAFTAAANYRVGPNYGRAFEQIVQGTANMKFPGAPNQPDVDLTGTATWKGPDLRADIPEVQPGMDFRAMLGRDQWAPPGAPAPGPAPDATGGAAGPPGVPGAAGGPGTMTYADWQLSQRQAADAALQGRQAQVPQPGVPQQVDPLRARLDADAELQARQAGIGLPPPPGPVAVPNTSVWRPPTPMPPPAPPMVPPIAATGAPGLVPDAANPFAGVIPYLPNQYDPYSTNYAWPHLTP